MVKVRYTYRLRPGHTAQRYLSREWGMCRFVWNSLVAESKARHASNLVLIAGGAAPEDVSTFGYAEQDRMLTELRASTVNDEGEHWLAAGSSVAQQQTVRTFAAARTKALKDRSAKLAPRKQRGLPQFKSRHKALPTMDYTLRGFSLKDVDGSIRLRLPGKIDIPVVWSRELPSAPTSARVYQDATGHWHVSFVVELDAQPLPVPTDAAPLGIDWGVAETATTTDDDYDLPHAEHGKTAAAKLARYQRMMARRRTPKNQPTTRGYRAAKRLAAKTSAAIANRRNDDAHKWAKKIVRNHAQIAVEDFNPKFLASTTMSRKAADGRIAAAKAALIWQATKHDRDLRLVNPANTTTDCSSCGARAKHRLQLSERIYVCETCGLVMPRDKNSAAVMVNQTFGTPIAPDRPGFEPADAEGVRPIPATVREPAA